MKLAFFGNPEDRFSRNEAHNPRLADPVYI